MKSNSLLIKNARLVNEGEISHKDIYIVEDRIELIGEIINLKASKEINAENLTLIPGVIDDQVHFREPGLTHKANINTESAAAVAGGVTTFMEMPNTKPAALTQELLEEKYTVASKTSHANYSFFMGASNDNLEEVLKTNPKNVCGVKVFMGSSTGNMLVDEPTVLDKIFKDVPMLIATHCEDEATVRANMETARKTYGEKVPFAQHPIIRSHDACYLSSSFASELAKKYNSRLHILHISTAKELELFRNDIPLTEKRITAEVCVHHLSLNDTLYPALGSKMKCNPAIKSAADQNALWEALNDDRLDIVATDHAPHTIEEKNGTYFKAPSGLPLIQHSLNLMLLGVQAGKISMIKMVEKMCHAPAQCFGLENRGYVREGYFADLVLIDTNQTTHVTTDNILYKCGWSPFEGQMLPGEIKYTIVNGEIAYHNGQVCDVMAGKRLTFGRFLP